MGIRSSSAPFDEYGWNLVKKDLERLSLRQYQILYNTVGAYSRGPGSADTVPEYVTPIDFTVVEMDVCVDGIPYKRDFLAGPLKPA